MSLRLLKATGFKLFEPPKLSGSGTAPLCSLVGEDVILCLSKSIGSYLVSP